jgi:hypothetical protein
MQLFAGLEANGLARSDGDFSTSPGIAADTGLARLYGEYSESAKFDTVASDEGLLHTFEDGVHCRLCFGSRQAGTFNNPLYKILLNHVGAPSLGCNFCKLKTTNRY